MTSPEPPSETELVAPPVIDAVEIPRNPWGWVVLAALFGLLIFASFGRKERAGDEARRASYAVRLKSALSTRDAGSNTIALWFSGYATPETPLRTLEKETAPRHLTEPVEAAVWAVVRTELKEPVSDKDLAAARRTPAYAPFAEIYSKKKLEPKAVNSLVTRLGKPDTLSELAANHARAQAGLAQVKTKGPSKEKAFGVGLLFLGLLFASGFSWLVLIAFGLSGMLQTLGTASRVRSAGEADRFAIRAATLMVAFILLGTVVGVLGIGGLIGQVLTYVPMLAVVPLILHKSPSMKDVGLSTENLGRNVLLGLWAFLLELPVTMVVAFVFLILMRNFPAPEHPAAVALEHGASLGTIIVTFVMGAIVAPFWEETMFRGLLFPALRKVLRGPIPAALLSSFLFASIHPQGPVLWAALATVALFSCVLAQNTRSLVPSVVMHFAHNATLLILTVLASGN